MLTHKVTMNFDEQEDEFGDTSFLANLDVDRVVEARRQSPQKEENDSPNKRRKVLRAPLVKKATAQSMNALRSFYLDAETCVAVNRCWITL